MRQKGKIFKSYVAGGRLPIGTVQSVPTGSGRLISVKAAQTVTSRFLVGIDPGPISTDHPTVDIDSD
jgi:hypothetical protein